MESVLSTINSLISQFDVLQLSALAIVLLFIIIALLVCIVVVAVKSLACLGEVRDLERAGYIRQHEELQGILRQINSCTADIAEIRQGLTAFAGTQDALLDERRRLLKSIAGHLKSP